MATTTSYGSFYNHTDFLTVGAYIADACSLSDSDWLERMEAAGAFDRIEADFSDAINDALPGGVALSGDEFTGPAYEEDYEDGVADLDISKVVKGIDFWAIVQKHDVGI
ncbi:hypothetical protein ABT357_25330 [Streptomyces albidoflavus]|uniref:hypothetical protein n=1 Tax=Streptomyces albidoflavus TaxID=1886 RepID=UPI003329E52A